MSSRMTLKSFFQTGDKPTAAEFTDLIDSLAHIGEDGLATQAFVTSSITSAVNGLLGGAPGALDTLDELAAALADDANFAATVTNTLAGKQNTLVSGSNIRTINGQSILQAGDLSLQNTLVSGSNIRTVNGQSLVGSGDIAISGLSGINDMSQTWNNGATVFDGIRLNVTDSASSAASNLLNLLVGGTSLFRVAKSGLFVQLGSNNATGLGRAPSTQNVLLQSNGIVTIQGSGVSQVGGTCGLLLGNSDYQNLYVSAGGFGGNIFIAPNIMGNSSRNGANLSLAGGVASSVGNWNGGHVLLDGGALNGAGVNGSIRIGTARRTILETYNAFTDESNYERAFLRWASNRCAIGTEAAGTGTRRPLDVSLFGGALDLGIGGASIASMVQNSNGFDVTFGGFPRVIQFFESSVMPATASNGLINLGTTLYSGRAWREVVSNRFVASDGVTAPGAVAGFAQIYVDAADGDLKVIFGDGVIKTLATDT